MPTKRAIEAAALSDSAIEEGRIPRMLLARAQVREAQAVLDEFGPQWPEIRLSVLQRNLDRIEYLTRLSSDRAAAEARDWLLSIAPSLVRRILAARSAARTKF